MAIVSSQNRLATTIAASPLRVETGSDLVLFNHQRVSYARLWRTQPEVRKCVDFLARNVAQLGLHVFRRAGETHRERLHDHPYARVIRNPNPQLTTYQLLYETFEDFGIYWNAYLLKLRDRQGLQLLRLAPSDISVLGRLVPEAYEWRPPLATRSWRFAQDDVIHLRGYDPENPLLGCSPLETLRRLLAKTNAAESFWERYYSRGGRPPYILTRPKEVSRYTPEQSGKFMEDWQTAVTEGRTPLLQEGMDLRELGWSAKDTQYLDDRKLTREEVANAYHIPHPMIGILDHATYTNVREMHKMLYQDTLAPSLVMIEQTFDQQLLSEFDDPIMSGIYAEFNIAEKLKGTFEEQTAALQTAVGRPWMTPNEARARLNLPPLEDDRANQVGIPLNIGVDPEAPPVQGEMRDA